MGWPSAFEAASSSRARADSQAIRTAIVNCWEQVVEHTDRDSKSKNAPLRSLTSAVDLVHLRYAVAAVDHGSFRRAAKTLLVRQSTLSRSIRQLEHSVGMSEAILRIVELQSQQAIDDPDDDRQLTLLARAITANLDSADASDSRERRRGSRQRRRGAVR